MLFFWASMKTIAQVLMDQSFKILGSNNYKQYMTLSHGDNPFHLLMPYQFIPADVLFERYKLEYLAPEQLHQQRSGID